ncbi:MAG: TetR/AcrR family transcriptional regulator C-terminal domain-containing protein [Acidimicrobiia bacterium]|nr:TetR/AcrR family transcriptional regulator C-terminal domain-containing protein [Acidimicrobiia bacterium]
MQDGRSPLSRERVLAAALGYIDLHGAEALSMRKLGAELGVEAMSLYNHVANKDDLLGGVASLLLELVEVPDPPLPDWRAQARLIADNVRAVGLAHPHAFPLLASRQLSSLDSWAPILAAFDLCRSAGLDDRAAAQAVSALSSYIVGAVLLEIGRADLQPVSVEQVPADRQLLRDYLEGRSGASPELEYRVGIDLLLAGIDAGRVAG